MAAGLKIPFLCGLFFGLDTAPGSMPEAQLIEQVAADSTGFELDRASKYFTRRKQKPREYKGETRPQRVTYRRWRSCQQSDAAQVSRHDDLGRRELPPSF